jgi:hypothetical protein
MATTERLQTATLSTDPGREMRSGGGILFIGALLLLATIGAEASIGWPPSDDSVDVPTFILKEWPSLRWIWAVQGLAGFAFGLSALVLLRDRHLNALWRPASTLWSAVAIGGVMLVVAFALTVGSYPPALLALEDNPEIFATVRGGVRNLFVTGSTVAWLGHIVLFLREGIAKDGVVPRSWLIGLAIALALAIMAAAFGLVRLPTAGLVTLFAPALLGLAIWKAGRQLAHHTPEVLAS